MSKEPSVEHKYHAKRDRLEITIKHYALKKKSRREDVIKHLLHRLERNPKLAKHIAKKDKGKKLPKSFERETKPPLVGD